MNRNFYLLLPFLITLGCDGGNTPTDFSDTDSSDTDATGTDATDVTATAAADTDNVDTDASDTDTTKYPAGICGEEVPKNAAEGGILACNCYEATAGIGGGPDYCDLKETFIEAGDCAKWLPEDHELQALVEDNGGMVAYDDIGSFHCPTPSK